MSKYYAEIEYLAKKTVPIEAFTLEDAHYKALGTWIALRDERPTKITVRHWPKPPMEILHDNSDNPSPPRQHETPE